ncbi:MAG: RluA family pseudouridine synthase [Thermosediminibacteraceae bacterium]|nr:RluA family pseudouridine synthase [Thermosediminibacteraceae bacterium]
MKFIVDEASQGLTVGEFLKARGFSRRVLKRLKNESKILLNGDPVYVSTKVSCSDVIEVDLSEETDIKPSFVPLDILYEDEHIIVLNKQPGIVVHPTPFHYDNTIANGVVYYLKQKGKKGGFHPVNRLDRDTSGVLIIALNQYMHHFIQNYGGIKKRYIAVVKGTIKEDEGVIEDRIGRKEGSLIERKVVESGKKAITRFKVMKRLPGFTVLDVEPVTGRTHQIRVHLSHKGHHVAGDTLYGGNCDKIKRQALHCIEMSFLYPVKKGARVTFKAPLPSDIISLIEEPLDF